MQSGNGNFPISVANCPLIINIFAQDYVEGIPLPPPGSQVRITDDSQVRITDSGDTRITD